MITNIVAISGILLLAHALSACSVAQEARPVQIVAVRTGPQPLQTPRRVIPGELNFSADRSHFAPVLTQRFPYPTQRAANEAYGRLLLQSPAGEDYPASISLFGCKPGALDAQTTRVSFATGPVVHCATDFLDPAGKILGRETVNFTYQHRRWHMLPVYPPHAEAPWRRRETSPRDPLGWLPFRSRYQ